MKEVNFYSRNFLPLPVCDVIETLAMDASRPKVPIKWVYKLLSHQEQLSSLPVAFGDF